MIMKYYDMEYGGSGGVHVVSTENKEAKTIVECECGTHMLQVMSDADIYTNSNATKQVQQSFYLAMFSYGNQKRGLFDRCVIAWKYLRSGKMFTDQLSLTPDEAKKLAHFINESIIETMQ